ncbi:MAG: hypothetical protein OXC40_03265, partial [Proteobacteria bacterium]|nr:hypothetical protein [Pseudomonadota bacterium]
ICTDYRIIITVNDDDETPLEHNICSKLIFSSFSFSDLKLTLSSTRCPSTNASNCINIEIGEGDQQTFLLTLTQSYHKKDADAVLQPTKNINIKYFNFNIKKATETDEPDEPGWLDPTYNSQVIQPIREFTQLKCATSKVLDGKSISYAFKYDKDNKQRDTIWEVFPSNLRSSENLLPMPGIITSSEEDNVVSDIECLLTSDASGYSHCQSQSLGSSRSQCRASRIRGGESNGKIALSFYKVNNDFTSTTKIPYVCLWKIPTNLLRVAFKPFGNVLNKAGKVESGVFATSYNLCASTNNIDNMSLFYLGDEKVTEIHSKEVFKLKYGEHFKEYKAARLQLCNFTNY